MKILILTHRVPFPQNGGYPIVVCNTIKGLVNLGHEVSLVSLNAKKHLHEEDEQDELLSKINYRVYDIDTSMSLFDGFLTTFSKTLIMSIGITTQISKNCLSVRCGKPIMISSSLRGFL